MDPIDHVVAQTSAQVVTDHDLIIKGNEILAGKSAPCAAREEALEITNAVIRGALLSKAWSWKDSSLYDVEQHIINLMTEHRSIQ